jgi:hypothetical protein
MNTEGPTAADLTSYSSSHLAQSRRSARTDRGSSWRRAVFRARPSVVDQLVKNHFPGPAMPSLDAFTTKLYDKAQLAIAHRGSTVPTIPLRRMSRSRHVAPPVTRTLTNA